MRLLPKYPLEALLRPPVEFSSAATFGLLAAAIVSKPEVFLIESAVAYGMGGVFALVAAFRVMQGFHLLRYQRSIKRSPSWRLDFGSIPNTPGTLFLGRGFNWTSKHAQRLRDTQGPSGRKYLDTTPAKSSDSAGGVTSSADRRFTGSS